MYNTFNICAALESVKNIYKNNLCPICDKTEVKFRRYLCGHTACENCASDIENCLFCLTPSDQFTSNNTALDDALTQRATNASKLLKTFEKAFNIDVDKHQRISEQLKLEKEIFPECIQAPIKYSNKRKSLTPYFKKKFKQLSKLPGEIIYSGTTKTMENSINSVEQWLNKNNENSIRNHQVNNKDDSGIVADDSIIDCSQITEDKDRNALLAVYEADKNALIFDSSQTNESEDWREFHDNELSFKHPKTFKEYCTVPFFKKSKLVEEPSALCNTHSNIFTLRTNVSENIKNVQISISNNNQYMQRIDVVKKKAAADSVPVQTDISEISKLKQITGYSKNTRAVIESKSLHLNVEACSQDVFTSEEIYKDTDASIISSNDTKIVAQAIVIEETDSDKSSITEEMLVQGIHTFQDPVTHGVLKSFNTHEEFLKRPKRRKRGLTPDSSNSSDKENMDPNRAKRARYGKKNKKK